MYFLFRTWIPIPTSAQRVLEAGSNANPGEYICEPLIRDLPCKRPLPPAMYVLPFRRWRLLVTFVFVFCSAFVLYLSYQNPDVRARLNAIRQGKWPALSNSARLPTYDRIIQLERGLPQHNLLLPYPEGKHGRYVKFSNQRRGLGWNNVLTEVSVDKHLSTRAI